VCWAGLDGATYHPLNLTSEPIFPPFLMTHPPRSAHYVGDTIDWCVRLTVQFPPHSTLDTDLLYVCRAPFRYKPTTLKAALALKAKHPEAQILAGNTRLVNKKLQPTVVISVGLVLSTFHTNQPTIGMCHVSILISSAGGG
jgi:hypothetical protein